MALIKCKECGTEVSDSAKNCPKCGAPTPKKTSLLTWFALFLFLLIGYSMSKSSSNIDSNMGVAPAATFESPDPTTTAPAIVQNWSYQTDTDKMSGKEAKYAESTSTNSHELKFPYQGGTKMTITLRKHPRMGTDAFVTVNKGQLDMNYDGTTIHVKFDDKKTMSFSVNGPDDGSRDTLFFENQKRFINNIKTAKHVIIEAQFYQEGNRQFEFNTDGLEWK